MAKNSKAIWIKLGLTIILIAVSVATAFVWAKADIKAVDTKATGIKEDVILLKDEGCLPARKNTNNITKIETQIKTMRDEQRLGFEAILRRLPNE